MKRTVVKTLGAAAACLLVGVFLWLTAQPAAGHPPEKQLSFNPGIKVSALKITLAKQQFAEGWFTITNETGGNQAVQIEQAAMAWQWIGQAGVRANCKALRFQWKNRKTGETVGQETTIPGGATITIDYAIVCDQTALFVAREVKNFVLIKLVGRSRNFGGSGSATPSS